MNPTRCPNCLSSEVVKLADGLWTCRACGGYVPSSQNGKAVIEISLVDQMLQVTTPKQSKAVEAIAAASQAWHKEQKNYEGYVNASYLYIMARRKTTELILPHVQHGGDHTSDDWQQHDDVVTLLDFGFTHKQWNRRVHELNIGRDVIDNYFDEIKANGWQPSINGLLKLAQNHSGHKPNTLQRFLTLADELMAGLPVAKQEEAKMYLRKFMECVK